MKHRPRIITSIFLAIFFSTCAHESYSEPDVRYNKVPPFTIIGAENDKEIEFAIQALAAMTQEIQKEVKELEFQHYKLFIFSKDDPRRRSYPFDQIFLSPYECDCGHFHLAQDGRLGISGHNSSDSLLFNHDIWRAAICLHLKNLPSRALEEWQAIAGDVYNPDIYELLDYSTKEKSETTRQEWDSYPKNGVLDILDSRSYLDDIRGYAINCYLYDKNEDNHKKPWRTIDRNDPRYMQKFTWLFQWGFIDEEKYADIKTLLKK